MSEKFPTAFEAPEKKIDDGIQKRLEAARKIGYDYYPEVPAEERREPNAEIIELESLMDRFELDHPLEDLFSITKVPVLGSESYGLRESAKKLMIEIVKRMRVLEEETTISGEKLADIKNRQNYLSSAIGFINDNMVRHNQVIYMKKKDGVWEE